MMRSIGYIVRLKKNKRRKNIGSGKPGSVCVLKVLKERAEVVVLSFVTSKIKEQRCYERSVATSQLSVVNFLTPLA